MQPAQVDTTNGATEPQSNGEASQRAVVPQPLQQLTEAERARKRAERFGVPLTAAATEVAKKDTKIAPSGFETDLDKLKKRAERFGLPPPTDKAEVGEHIRVYLPCSRGRAVGVTSRIRICLALRPIFHPCIRKLRKRGNGVNALDSLCLSIKRQSWKRSNSEHSASSQAAPLEVIQCGT